MGKVVQPLQSVDCHYSRAHGHERHGSFTGLVGIWLVGMVRVGSSRSGSWYEAGVKPMCKFGYRWDACKRWSFLLQV
jgi:hypothetical protein